MSRAERVLWLVNEMHRLDVKWGTPERPWDPEPWLLGWINGSVKPDNGKSDMQARAEVQEAIEAWRRFLDERMAAVLVDQEVVTGPAALTGSQQQLVDEALAEPRVITAVMRQAAEAAGLKFEREDPEASGEPLPDGVDGFPAGGRG